MGAGLLLFFMGLACLIGPNVLPNQMPLIGKLILAIVGAVLLVLGVIVTIVTQLYVKASADIALVRTGSRGMKPILNGGTIFIPVIHKLIQVNLKVMKIKIEDKVLICGDYMRAEMDAEFYIRVGPTPDEVQNAAVTLGDRTMQENQLKELIEEKLTNVLRTVAANMKLIELNRKRDDFQKAVIEALTTDLGHNGLRLETVAISRLDQAAFDPNAEASNVFDAEGHKEAQIIISAAAVAKNIAKRDAELEIANKDRETREQVANQEFLQEQANAVKDANVSKAHSAQQREAEVFKQEQRLASEQARLQTEQSIGTRDAEKNREIQVANIQSDQAAQTAEQLREQAVEVASRNKDIAVAEAEKARALAQADQQKAEQSRTAEEQGVLTVAKTAEAERTKAVTVIAAKQAADVKQTEENREAEIEAYRLKTIAAGQLNATEQDANARRIRAEAERDALTAEAEGQSKVASVPVNVKAREVEVDSQRVETVDRPSVDVLKAKLTAQDEHTQVSVELEKFRIMVEAQKAIGIAQAQAMGQALASADMRFFGNPEMLDAFVKRFATGQGMQGLAEGLGLGDISDIGQLLGKVPALRDLAGQLQSLVKGKGAAAETAEASA